MNETVEYHERMMWRCLDLAILGAGHVAPNPMVGAVIVYDGKIIGEGFHRQYGEAHAELNAVRQAIANGFEEKLASSSIYVSLEPCAHFGKTPPCADLIIHHRIPNVIIGCRDPFKEVNGKGIEKLVAAGTNITTGMLEPACKEINKRFFTFHSLHRPYIILKWAQTADKRIAGTGERLLISNENTNRIVHKWRSEESSILVGTNTALADNPSLTTRLWPGSSPVRLVVDINLRLSQSLHLFDRSIKTIVFNKIKHEEEEENLLFYQITEDVSLVHQILNALYQLKIQSILVEGGAVLLQSFFDEGLWDEARVITNPDLTIKEGLFSPVFNNENEISVDNSTGDLIQIFKPAL